MIGSWENGLTIFFRTVSQILTAGIAITALALLLYAMTFNLRDRVARSFALILFFVVIVFSSQAIGSSSEPASQMVFLFRMQWIGIIFLPAAFLHFSDALLATTGKPSRWRRFVAIRVAYVTSTGFLALLLSGLFIGPVIENAQPTPHIQSNLLTDVFILYYLLAMGMAWFNFARAYRRTTTTTSRRRMAYLIVSAIAPAVGSFPFLFYGTDLAIRHTLGFWVFSAFSNVLLGVFLILMAYAVAFFGVPWPDRIVKSRLFKWILRGPVMASFTLASVTIVRRVGEVFGTSYSALVPITMVATILTWQYLITLFSPLWENWLFFGNDQDDMRLMRRVEEHLLTRNDLRQFLEMILAAVCDRLQAPGAYIAALNGDGFELVVKTGKVDFEESGVSNQLTEMINAPDSFPAIYQWGNDFLVPLMDSGEEDEEALLGVLAVSDSNVRDLDDEELQSLSLLSDRAALALRDRHIQKQVFEGLQNLTPAMDYIQRVRAAARYDGSTLLLDEVPDLPPDFSQYVKEALTHYWGGPKLTESPLIKLKIVQEVLDQHDMNPANALRSILKEAIEKVKPEGERRFTAEWILYNILEMKFLEGRKVREVALRLAMSEADLYRKQRIAIDAVTKAIQEMETQARSHVAG